MLFVLTKVARLLALTFPVFIDSDLGQKTNKQSAGVSRHISYLIERIRQCRVFEH